MARGATPSTGVASFDGSLLDGTVGRSCLSKVGKMCMMNRTPRVSPHELFSRDFFSADAGEAMLGKRGGSRR